jgi:hypothetical protein
LAFATPVVPVPVLAEGFGSSIDRLPSFSMDSSVLEWGAITAGVPRIEDTPGEQPVVEEVDASVEMVTLSAAVVEPAQIADSPVSVRECASRPIRTGPQRTPSTPSAT